MIIQTILVSVWHLTITIVVIVIVIVLVVTLAMIIPSLISSLLLILGVRFFMMDVLNFCGIRC